MKKLLFFKSSSHGEHQVMSTAARDKRHHIDTRWKRLGSENVKKKIQHPRDFSPVSERKVAERKTISRTSSLVLRRSRSLSMSSEADGTSRLGEDLNELRTHRKFPSSSAGVSGLLCDCPECYYQFKDRESKSDRLDPPSTQHNDEALNGCFRPSYPSSPRSSFGSTSFPDPVLDLYIDSEYLQQKYNTREHHPSNPPSIGRSNSSKHRSDSSSLSNIFIPSDNASRASLRSERHQDSPRKLAKDVVERLLRLEKSYDSKPIDIGDIWPPVPTTSCDKTLDEPNYSSLNVISGKGDIFFDREYRTLMSEQKLDDNGLTSTLERKLEEAKERAMLLTREFSQDRSFQYYSGNVTELSQMIRNLLERERNLVLELSDQFQGRIAERTAAKKAVSLVKEEMTSMSEKLGREKDELQHRLRELAEQNVSLQKDISSFYKKEKEYINRISHLDAGLKDVTAKMDETRSENDVLQIKMSEIQEKLKVTEEVQFCVEGNFKEKEKENAGLIKSVARLQSTCNEQEKTIDGLRQSLGLGIEKQKASDDKLDNLVHKLKMEQLRLTGVEQFLRRQLESNNVEVDSLRHENIYLLDRLKAAGKVGGSSSIKLDQELQSCVNCLQNMGLTLLNESIQMNAKLIGTLKSKGKRDGFIEAQILFEYDAKVQGFKQGAEQLTRSLGKTASVLSEKGEPVCGEPDSFHTEDERCQSTEIITLEDDLKAEFKAERLLTSLLKEKLFYKEKEVELMQAELARATRNLDVLRSEIQDAYDTVSHVNHKMKNLELQMIQKHGTINQLQGEVRSHEEELSSTRGILSKVTQERDLMWEEVKQYSEKNMLLNCEVNTMKKKLEGLEEDTLLKDGQISILKDSLSNARSYDVLFAQEL